MLSRVISLSFIDQIEQASHQKLSQITTGSAKLRSFSEFAEYKVQHAGKKAPLLSPLANAQKNTSKELLYGKIPPLHDKAQIEDNKPEFIEQIVEQKNIDN